MRAVIMWMNRSRADISREGIWKVVNAVGISQLGRIVTVFRESQRYYSNVFLPRPSN